jgi:GGDEF domain-containing protein
MVHIRNLQYLDRRYSPSVIGGSLKALLERLSDLLDANAVIGRWSENCFAAIVELQPAKAIALSRAASLKLSGEYAVQEKGLSQKVPLVAVTGVIDQIAGGDETSFRKKLTQMSEALASE